ncbi:MAG: winged helix-turn-helix domain-containing protein [Thermoplasmata archaeon]|nr:MAG: winged helix-turn-helix domain-containing protein [Thermoplasmata archaeon]
MEKKELVYRQLFLKPETTQLELSQVLGISLSTVNNAIKPLRGMGAVHVGKRRLRVTDREKLLLYWASARTLHDDIIYRTRVELPVKKIEKSVPSDIIFTAYSGYRLRYKEVPADYSEVYIYSSQKELDSVKMRFHESEKVPNLFVLEADEHLLAVTGEGVVPDCQLFVDLWNLSEWYAKEFVIRLRERIL